MKYTSSTAIIRPAHLKALYHKATAPEIMGWEELAQLRAIDDWLAMLKAGPKQTPLCAACDNDFKVARYVKAFLFTVVTDNGGMIVAATVSGVCKRCSKLTDKALCERAAPYLLKWMGPSSKITGFVDENTQPPSSGSVQ